MLHLSTGLFLPGFFRRLAEESGADKKDMAIF